MRKTLSTKKILDSSDSQGVFNRKMSQEAPDITEAATVIP